MHTIIKNLFIQELFFSGFLVVLGLIVGVQHGLQTGVRTFLYGLLFIQPAILVINIKIIKDVLFPAIKERKTNKSKVSDSVDS